ncbi:carotenoid oxygenase family protein [Streptomyces sp. NBC_00280]|uniref:carotenoid oxygenase family protein n=1 Tax=Streptomyces sp. NBC_00280 TaxID=2975699 RepID=UPI00324788B0
MNPKHGFQGAYTPVAEEVTSFDLPVTGTIPAELNGRYLRNGPNPLNLDEPRLHLFTGTGMVHGVRLREGKAEWYRNRWVRSARVAEALGERPRPGASMRRVDTGPNTHVIGHANRTFALVEAGSRPYELTYDLDTVGACDFDGTLRDGFVAHPKLDPTTGELHAVTYVLGGDTLTYLVVSPLGKVVRSVAISAPHAPMMHDFALTQRYAVLYDLPVTFSQAAVDTGKPFPMNWNEARGGRIGLLPRSGTEVRWFDVNPCWVFHTLNAYDQGDTVVVDVVRYPQMFAGAELMGNSLPTLDRWVIDTVTGRVTETRLDDHPQEFPVVSPAVVTGAHRYGYSAVTPDLIRYAGPVGTLDGLPVDAFSDSLIKHDLDRQTATVRDFGTGHYTSEAYFVPSQNARTEDDGYVLAYVFDPERGATDLVILSGQDFTGAPIATVHLPARVPLGFHGSWIPDPA